MQSRLSSLVSSSFEHGERSQAFQALLSALSACVGTDEPDTSVYYALTKGNASECTSTVAIVAFDRHQPLKCRHEAFHCLRALASNYQEAAFKAWHLYASCVKQFAAEQDDKLAVHALRLVSETIRTDKVQLHTAKQLKEASSSTGLSSETLADCWMQTITSIIPESLYSLGGEARSSAVNMFLSLTGDIYKLLEARFT